MNSFLRFVTLAQYSVDSSAYYNHNLEALVQLTERKWSPESVRLAMEGVERGATVLEIGSGFGRDLSELARMGYVASGLDNSERCVQWSRQKYEVLVRQANALLWSPPESSLDAVWMDETLNHMDLIGAQRVLNSAFKGVRPQGRLSVAFLEGDTCVDDRCVDFLGPTRTLFLHRLKAMSALIEQCGFQILRVGKHQDSSRTLMICTRIG